FLPQRLEALAAPGEKLVSVRLMADVPDDEVARRIEHGVEREREFDGAEARAQVTAGVAHDCQDFVTDLAGQLLQLRQGESLEIGRGIDGVEQAWRRQERSFVSVQSGGIGSGSIPPGSNAASQVAAGKALRRTEPVRR